MIINSARFLVSAPNEKKCPADVRHEYAFIGRSNVGKSSLINMLLGRKDLAKTSATPGKTMLINHFLVNDEWALVATCPATAMRHAARPTAPSWRP